VALVGYDDQYWAKSIMPSLTTVRQPAYKIGKQAVETVLALLKGEKPAKRVSYPNEMVVRQSCGCLSQAVLRARIDPPLTEETLESGLLAKRETILAEIDQILSTEVIPTDPEWPGQLFDALIMEIKNESPRKFLLTLNYIMDQLSINEYNVMIWQEVISIMRRYTLPCIRDDSELFRVENLLQQGRVLIAEVAQRIQTSQSARTDRQAYTLGKVSEVIQTTFDLAKLTKVVVEEFPKLEITSCYLSLYERGDNPPEWSRLIMAYDESGLIDVGEVGIRFPTRQLIPEGLITQDKQYSFVVEPLYFREEQLGFAIFNIDPKQHQVYESLRILLSSAIKGADLVKELTKKESELEQRAESLMRSNAELEQFAYVASHDLQEPLRMVASYLQLLERRYKGKLDNNADEFIGFAVDGAVRMQNLINDLLAYSRVSTRGKPFEPVDCSAIVDRVLTNLKIAIEESGAIVTCDPMPTLPADSGQMVQLFQNLISNAVKFRSKKTPEVYIKAERQIDGWLFSVRDNGIGLDMQQAERIFLIFQRLHSKEEYPGTGIGLAVCKRIIERHGGRIWVVSEPGKGATFYFTIRTEGGHQIEH
jgi:signal transduction histidine kinase